jgi:DNA-binding transcriptional MerR regulator
MNESKPGFSAGQVARLTGLSYRTIDYWARTGLVVPSIARASGTRTLRRIVAFIQKSRGLSNPLAEQMLVLRDDDVLIVENQADLVSALRRPGQMVFSFVLDIGKVASVLREAVARAAA